jgi:type III secretory pathway component EscV
MPKPRKGGGLWKTMKRAMGFKSKKKNVTRKYWRQPSNTKSKSDSISRSKSDEALLQFNRKKTPRTKKSIFDDPRVAKSGLKPKTKVRNPMLQHVLSSKRRSFSDSATSRSLSSLASNSKTKTPLKPPSKTMQYITIMNEDQIRNSNDIPTKKLELSDGSTILVNDIKEIEIIGFDTSKGTIDINIIKTLNNKHNFQKEAHIRRVRIQNDTLLKSMKQVVNKQLEEFVTIRKSAYPSNKEVTGQYTKKMLKDLQNKFKNAVQIKD